MFLSITSLFCNKLIHLHSVNYSLPTQLHFLPQIITSPVLSPLIFQSVCCLLS